MQGVLASDLTLTQVKSLSIVQRLPLQMHSDELASLPAQMHLDAQTSFYGEVWPALLALFARVESMACVTQPASNPLQPAVLCCVPVRHVIPSYALLIIGHDHAMTCY